MATELVPGNYMSFEATTSGNSGGFLMRYNTNVSFYNVNYYSPIQVHGRCRYGIDHFENWYIVRRPNTDRLNGGGWLPMAFRGGAWS